MFIHLLVDILNDLLYGCDGIVDPGGLVGVVVEDAVKNLAEAVEDISLDPELDLLVLELGLKILRGLIRVVPDVDVV